MPARSAPTLRSVFRRPGVRLTRCSWRSCTRCWMTKRRFTDQFQVLRRTLSKGMGSFSQNLAEPWMAEQSVQGRIHSVFWEKLPIPLRGARLAPQIFEQLLAHPAPGIVHAVIAPATSHLNE